MNRSQLALFALCILISSRCFAECTVFDICNGNRRGHNPSQSTKPAYPTTNSKVSVNPSAVPVEKGLGIEGLFFGSGVDLSLVQGLGRVGAAVSPSNSEETFFGPPGFELPEDFLDRKKDQAKYPSQKVTVATAFGLIKNRKSGLKRFDINLGAMARYNRLTKAITPGGGLSGVIGPLTFAYSLYSDQTQLDYSPYGLSLKPKIFYTVENYSVGLFLSNLAIDYSVLRLITNDIATTSVLTASLLLRRAIFTISNRTEISSRVSYNTVSKYLEKRRNKYETFLGAQWSASSHFMIGIFYNYYVLHELSAGATLFF